MSHGAFGHGFVLVPMSPSVPWARGRPLPGYFVHGPLSALSSRNLSVSGASTVGPSFAAAWSCLLRCPLQRFPPLALEQHIDVPPFGHLIFFGGQTSTVPSRQTCQRVPSGSVSV